MSAEPGRLNKLPVYRLIPGDVVDLDDLPYPIQDPGFAGVSEFEFAQVDEIEVESAECYVVHTNLGSYAVPPEHELTWVDNLIRSADRRERPDVRES